ncbi:jg2704 [Pararge aegeria aegeria]|uniref:Jg2704 protein n=1 Tax=Pararge aegeria aegeria TaxID=348720 RepID=A0A8S4R235_9NEOP|nr:jg2704 [Pararge aegeria aegeria]
MRRTLEGWDGGVRIGGVKLTNLRHADDTSLLAASETEMTSLLDRMEQISNAMGLFINRSKTKAMLPARSATIVQEGWSSLAP